MTLDLFADPEPIAAAPAPAPVATPSATARTEGESFPMLPMPGQVNRWLYKGEIVTYDTHKLSVPGRGRWSSVEGIGKPVVRGDSHAVVCRAIDAWLAAQPTRYVDCGECPRVSTGCEAGQCLKAS